MFHTADWLLWRGVYCVDFAFLTDFFTFRSSIPLVFSLDLVLLFVNLVAGQKSEFFLGNFLNTVLHGVKFCSVSSILKIINNYQSET
jgi:hypothetical protein